MIDVLIQGSLILTGSEAIREGYVYVSNGVVKGVGAGLPPEEYTRATLVLGGEGRIVAPGLAVAADAAAYPIRLLRPGAEEKARFYRALGGEAALYSALPAVYELHLHGATTILIEFTEPSLPLRLAEAVGGRYGLVLPCGHDSVPEKPAALAGLLRQPCDSRLPGFLESPPVYRPSLLARPWEASIELRWLYGEADYGLREGARAEIAVFNASRPPGMLLDRIDIDLDTLYSLGLTVESLVVGDEVIVDRGEHLYITDTHLDRARSLALRLLQGQ